MSGFLRAWALRHLARPQPAQRFVPQIDGLRCVAILAVILYHLQGYLASRRSDAAAEGGWVNDWFAQGFFGVPLFFALSGYILCAPFLGPQPPRLRSYFLRRLTRLEPPYLINLLLIFALKLWALDLAFPELFPHLLASLVYAHGWVYGAHSGVNGVAWSLEIEWQFYVLAPALFAWLVSGPRRSRALVLILLLAAGGLVHAFQQALGPRVGLSLLHYFGFFAAGVAVAFSEEAWRSLRGGMRFDLLGLAAAGAILCVLLNGSRPLIACLPALTALAMVGALRGPWLCRALAWWPVHCIGAMCYSIYIYHFFAISALARVLPDFGRVIEGADAALLVMTVTVVPAVLLVCTIPYLLIERPFMVWRPGRNRLIDAFRHRIVAAAG